MTRFPVLLRLGKTNAGLLALVFFAGCASLKSTSSKPLDQPMAHADSACRNLNANNRRAYNEAVASIARQMDNRTPDELRGQLSSLGVTLELPAAKLPLARLHAVQGSIAPNDSPAIGAPILLEYDTANAPQYPRDGLIIPATAIYTRVHDAPHLSLLIKESRVQLNGTTYPLRIDNSAAVNAMAKRGQHIAGRALSYMLHPATIGDGSRIVLTEPYDPNKIPVLMVHGLQSSPLAFVGLTNAIRCDPVLSQRFQVWAFFYATGTPVFFNALELRQELDRTIHALDPHDRDFATRHIVVLGHSMGGIMTHTLVSSSGERLWNALFTVPPSRLRGDKPGVRELDEGLHFRRNPRVVRAIFISTPHRGSKMADSWIGHLGESLIHLPTGLQNTFVDVANENRDVATPQARAFHKQLNFSAVHTLSPNDPVLNALAPRPIAVPFHSIVGQHNSGPIETSSDGVVPYTSSHLAGAASELVVRSGHNAFATPDGQREIMRILRLELQSAKQTNEPVSLAGR